MIDEDRTMQLFEYTSDELSSGSHKHVVAVCEECGRYHISEMRRLKDMCHSCAVSGERSSQFGKTGDKNASFGIPLSNATKLKISIAQRGEKSHMYGKHVPYDTRAKISASTTGDKHWHWKGGKITVLCYVCGKEINLWPSYIHDKNFCNVECKNVYNATMENRIALSAMQQGIDTEDWQEFVPNGRHHVVHKYKCIKMNDYFIGSDAHHITKSIIVYIPSVLHQHIKHNLKTGYNMGEINMLATQYITRWW